MTDIMIIQIIRESLMTILIVSAPMLAMGMVVGLVVAIFQTTTSIQEQTLTFVPKIIAIFGAIMVFGPWMIRTLIDYTHHIFAYIHKAGISGI